MKKNILTKKIADFDSSHERSFVVLSGLNSDNFNLSRVKGLNFYEERMLFFLFLLKFQKTRIIYVTSSGFNTDLFKYYISTIFPDPKKAANAHKRLIHIQVEKNNSAAVESLSERLLKDDGALGTISENILDKKMAMLRCYNPMAQERAIAKKLGIPIFGHKEKFDYIGTKSGARKVFNLAGLKLIPGYSYIKDTRVLYSKILQLHKDFPHIERMMIKLNESSSGRGNCIFNFARFLEKELGSRVVDDGASFNEFEKSFDRYAVFQSMDQNYSIFKKEFERLGGVCEIYISGEKNSPSVQVQLLPSGGINIVSTHEQILGGPDRQRYIGCGFPSDEIYRAEIIAQATKVARWMVKKEMVGNFSVDFLAVKNGKDYKLYPIEINLRKGGTTHPFRITYFLTGAKYNKKTGLLQCGETPIYYHSMDFIESEKYKKLTPADLIKAVSDSKISFDKDTKKGVLLFMPGMISEFGRFGAVCIGHSREEAKRYYKKLVELVDSLVQ